MTMKCNEEMIEVAVKHLGHEFLTEAAGSAEEGCAVSDSFDKRMRALIGRKAARVAGRRAFRNLSRVAAILFVVVVIFTVAVLSSEALRARVINLLVEVGGGRAQIGFTDSNTEQLPEGIVLPGYLPDGYELVKADTDGTVIVSQYKNEAGDEITIRQGSLDVQVGVMQTDAVQTQIAGRTVYALDQNGKKIVIFNNDWYSFVIRGDMDVSELLIIAESMLK